MKPSVEQVKAAARRAGIDVDAEWRYSPTSSVGDRPWLWADEWRAVRRELNGEVREDQVGRGR